MRVSCVYCLARLAGLRLGHYLHSSMALVMMMLMTLLMMMKTVPFVSQHISTWYSIAIDMDFVYPYGVIYIIHSVC